MRAQWFVEYIKKRMLEKAANGEVIVVPKGLFSRKKVIEYKVTFRWIPQLAPADLPRPETSGPKKDSWLCSANMDKWNKAVRALPEAEGIKDNGRLMVGTTREPPLSQVVKYTATIG